MFLLAQDIFLVYSSSYVNALYFLLCAKVVQLIKETKLSIIQPPQTEEQLFIFSDF